MLRNSYAAAESRKAGCVADGLTKRQWFEAPKVDQAPRPAANDPLHGVICCAN